MKREKKGLAIGNSNFKDIIEKEDFYVDKSKFIEEFIKDSSKVKLFTRPRRFGKTLNMSMLKYFFDIKNAEENKKLFNDLYISKTKEMEYQGQHPVIFISMRSTEAENWDKSFFNIRRLIFDLYREFAYLREQLEDYDLEEYNQILKKEENIDWENSIKNLSRYLYEYYGKKVVILIDEYDTPITSAWSNGYYEKSRNFFKNLYANALKDNEYLEKAAVTGILRVAKEGIFSGLNNLKVYTVLNDHFGDSFGLTEKEVKKALEYYELIDNFEEVRKWYDGYKFGDIQIYNPWSILNYLDEKEINIYWVNTSDNKLIYSAIENADKDMFDDLREVFNNGVTEQLVNASSNMDNLRDSQEVWQLLLFGGYLTVENKIGMNIFNLKLPNYEVRTFFEKTFIQKLGGSSRFRNMIKAFKKGDTEGFEEILNEALLVSMSYYDGNKIEEKSYHNLILGMMLSLDNEYRIISNGEVGYGRNDLVLEPIDKKNRGYIFEFKVSETEEKFEEDLEKALKQIEEKKYPIMLKERGVKEVVHIGMAFCGKKVKVKSKIGGV